MIKEYLEETEVIPCEKEYNEDGLLIHNTFYGSIDSKVLYEAWWKWKKNEKGLWDCVIWKLKKNKTVREYETEF